jgi:glyceraldehyde 3-phosphate dehydrogenase
MSVKVGINGFGRIGRLTARAIMQEYQGVLEVVAVNDLSDPETNAHLFKWDSTYGPYEGEVSSESDALIIDDQTIRSFAEKDPSSIDWSALGVQVVVESTGVFTDRDGAAKHLGGTVKKVVISAPAKGEDATLVLGVNDETYDPASHHVISNASCTTNCIAPMCKVLDDAFGIEAGLMTTIHAYTNDQRIQDQVHRDLRRARAAGQNIIPTSTGAAKAIGLVLPQLKGKLHGFAVRVPIPTVSMVDLTVTLKKGATKDDINSAMMDAATGSMDGILALAEEPLVSSDFVGSDYSCVIDSELTMTMGDNMAKVIGWYDNEWAYAMRVADLIQMMNEKGL